MIPRAPRPVLFSGMPGGPQNKESSTLVSKNVPKNSHLFLAMWSWFPDWDGSDGTEEQLGDGEFPE